MTSVNKWLSFVAAGCAALIMIIATVDVITTKAFAMSVPSGKHFIEDINAVMILLAAAYVTQEKGHVQMALLRRWMSSKMARVFRLFGHALGTLVIGFCTWRSMALVLDSLAKHSYRYGPIDYPLWPFQILVLLGFALMTIAFIILFVKEIKGS